MDNGSEQAVPVDEEPQLQPQQLHNAGQKRQKSQEQEAPRKRARLSCNTCKARKTKCIGIETGACNYCRSLNLHCEASVKSRKRPFYRVSEEVYEHSIKLLRRFVSEEELPDLTVENIQDLLHKLDNGSDTAQPSISSNIAVASVENEGARPPADVDEANETMEADEHPVLQEELGCLLLDSMGKYRYVGAHSSIRWFNAICAARDRRAPSSRSDPKIITPLKIGPLPPTTPENVAGARRTSVYLPPRQLCMQYVSRFFDQIHCIYWFFSPEQFYPRLDQTLEDGGVSASASWLCIIYSIFTMGSMREGDGDFPAPGNSPHSSKTAPDYLAIAKEISAQAIEEADIDTVKAFGLLGLATHAMCYSITAYLHLGTAVRIAFSLGLHRDVFLKSKGSLERERSRRLWWTMYILDYEMASRFGYPPCVMDDTVFVSTPHATEQMLEPGPSTPLGYQALLVSLCQMTKMISHECFLEPAHVGGRLPISRVTRSLAALQRWYTRIPSHVHWDSSLHPQHRRAVSLLHLRFWSTTILLTRPFLLFTFTRSTSSMIPAKRVLYEQLSNTCIEAAESAATIFTRMHKDQTLSSLVLFDSHCMGEVMGILIMAVQKRGGTERQAMIKAVMDAFRSMEKIGWCARLTPELELTVEDSRVLQTTAMQAAPPQPPEPFDPRTVGAVAQIPGDGTMAALPDYPELEVYAPTAIGWTSANSLRNRNFDGSQFDVFETLDLETGTGLMGMFTDASFSGSQFLFDNPDAVYQV